MTQEEHDVLDRVIARKDAEIDRLSARCAFMASNDYVYSLTSEIERLQFLNKEERETIEELSRLCTRAADALGPYALGFPDGSDIRALIAELRKAAE